MRYRKIVYELSDFRASIKLPKPEAGCSIDEVTADELRECCERLRLEDRIRVVTITGSGGIFAIGRKDAPEDVARAAATQRMNWIGRMAVAGAFAALPMPTVAVINGDAFGHGLELAMAADLRIAIETATLSAGSLQDFPFPYDGATQRLPRLVGPGMARDMLLTGRVLSSREALDTGLVNRVVPETDLDTAASQLVKNIIAAAPIASRYAKEAVGASGDLTLGQGLHLEADLSVILHSTHDRGEGLRSFADKRAPNFEGR